VTSLKWIDTDKAVSLRNSGLPWSRVAELLGSTVFLVRRALAKAGHEFDDRYQTDKVKPLLTTFQLDRVTRLRQAGASWKELGRMLNIDWLKLKRYVYRVRRKA
jgi:hypothetical protein